MASVSGTSSMTMSGITAPVEEVAGAAAGAGVAGGAGVAAGAAAASAGAGAGVSAGLGASLAATRGAAGDQPNERNDAEFQFHVFRSILTLTAFTALT